MDDNKCIITIILPILITGSKGTELPFVPNRQYCYVEKGFYDYECYKKNCGRIGIYKMPGYVVEINEELFIVWATNAVENIPELTEREQEGFGRQYVDHIKFDHVKDYKKEAKEVLGLDIKAHERTDFNGRWLEKFLR